MTLANTVSLQTNLNVDPYYDDFDETKNFRRILFQPGLAVQARELTQIQTMLQNQIDRFAEHVFKEGASVLGLEDTQEKIQYVKIRDNDSGLTEVDVDDFVNVTITGGTSGVSATVVNVLDGSEAGSPNTKTLYVKYLSGSSDGANTVFVSGEQLTGTGVSANVITEGVQSTSVVGSALKVEFKSGILFSKDHFIYVPAANTIVGRYTIFPNKSVGFNIVESLTDSDTDSTLLDPARGARNYAAPGADRLKLTPTLTVKELTDTGSPNYVEKLRFDQGRISTGATSQSTYSLIDKYISERTFDESGNYIVEGMNIFSRPHLNNGTNGGLVLSGNGGNTNLLVAGISPGKAYVKGRQLSTNKTHYVAYNKGTSVEEVSDISIPANYGNYTTVDNVVGTWDVNGHDVVDLYDSEFNAISNNTFSASSITGRNKIGEARVRSIKYASGKKGTPSGQQYLYLYDIQMSANSFNYVRGIHYDNGSDDGFADIVLDAGGDASLTDSEFNRAIFNTGGTAIKRIRDGSGVIDNEFRFHRSFDVTIDTNGQFTLTVTPSNEQFPFSVGALNSAQERENFYLVLTGTATSASAVDTGASKTAGANTITGLSSADTKYNVGDRITIDGVANTLVVSGIGTTSLNVFGNSVPGTGSGDVNKSFTNGQVISFNGVGGDAAARTITINTVNSADFDIQETISGSVTGKLICNLKKVDQQEISKVIKKDRYVELNVSRAFANVNQGSPGLSGPWPLGMSDGFKLKEVRVRTDNTSFSTTSDGTDVTNQFELDTGMKDGYYDHAKLNIKPGATHSVANGNVYLVKFDYFTHDTSSGIGYLSVDSYPIDDSNPANPNAIQTAEIPIYQSKTTGVRYDLRNHIDIRPRITDTATDTTTLTGISINPDISSAIIEPSGGLRFSVPDEDFIVDYENYLPRKDRLTLTENGGFRIVEGTPEANPKTPNPPADAMSLAILNVSPYPSLDLDTAASISTATHKNGRSDLAVKTEPTRVRRYTMKDIRSLEERIDNLEYYTSLSLLESDTKNTFIAGASGVDRFKNGFVVDNFVDFTTSDYRAEDFKVAIDRQKKELRPQFKTDSVELLYDAAASSGTTRTMTDVILTIASGSVTYTAGETISQGGNSGTLRYQVDDKLYVEQETGTFTTGANAVGALSGQSQNVTAVSRPSAGKLVTLDYSHYLATNQSKSSTTRNLTTAFYGYEGGRLILDPATDFWKDTVQKPTVQVDFGNISDALINNVNSANLIWGSWENIGRINESVARDFSTAVIDTNTSRTGFTIQAGQLIETDLGESIRDINIVPYMRSRVINFRAIGLRPSTRHYAFFDGRDVQTYCRPTDSSYANTAAYGGSLLTDASGDLYGQFRIPADSSLKFPSGSLTFRLVDERNNNTSRVGFPLSIAEATYSTSGLSFTQQRTVVSTREIELVETRVPVADNVVDKTNNITNNVTQNAVTSVDPGGISEVAFTTDFGTTWSIGGWITASTDSSVDIGAGADSVTGAPISVSWGDGVGGAIGAAR